jgi:4-hydroxysphinganine ceramide fatty acyl 2-hydroxylase
MRKSKGMIRDFFLFPDVLIMVVLFLASLSLTVLHVSAWSTWIAVIAGMLGYMVTEYLTHRFIFHMKPPKHPFFLRFLKRIHYDHHVDPNNLHLLFLPIWYSIPNLFGFSCIVYWITASFIVTNAFVTGTIFFLLCYEWTHYVAHRPIRPLTSWGKWMKKIHMWHHYKNENYWYGVTTPVFDCILGTFPDEKDVEKSLTARNLEGREGTIHL